MRTQRLFLDKPTAIVEGVPTEVGTRIASGSMNSFAYSFYGEIYQRHEYRKTSDHTPCIFILNGMPQHCQDVGRKPQRVGNNIPAVEPRVTSYVNAQCIQPHNWVNKKQLMPARQIPLYHSFHLPDRQDPQY